MSTSSHLYSTRSSIHVRPRMTPTLTRKGMTKSEARSTLESICYLRVVVLGYNQLVDHVGIHGQRRLTEALNKDSLVWQKEYLTESSSKSRECVYIETSARRSRGILEQWSVGQGARTRRQGLSRSEHDARACRIQNVTGVSIAISPENAAYRAVAFSGPAPEFEREKDRPWIAVQVALF
ncbi:hypothetical protein Taro_020746 [Colocasia esculenta]|uniref:Uncharacterized protein n=1 Tax=Colocasia esculenta TaxID=4460 RepID=A0A843V9F2_COLES|nr:hypothetical protein [Colocasia esculenta]